MSTHPDTNRVIEHNSSWLSFKDPDWPLKASQNVVQHSFNPQRGDTTPQQSHHFLNEMEKAPLCLYLPATQKHQQLFTHLHPQQL